MPRVDLVVETDISRTPRARQLEGMFDVPPTEKARREWHADIPLETNPWSVGLIVGPSGAGKSLVARQLFGDAVDRPLEWRGKSVIDDFAPTLSMEEISAVCQAVGFNTVPAWLRPHGVLSNGERFRVDLARRLLEGGALVVVDEFTSVVDRQVAKIGAHAVQKWVRKAGSRFVAVTCHHDVEDWLQPDWVFEPATSSFRWRGLQRRPPIECVISPISYAAWSMFAPYHYLTASLHRAARCFGLYVDGELAAFAGMLYRPHPTAKNIMGCSRLVTLPDYQGLGLAFVLIDKVAAIYRAVGRRTHTYPAHPSLMRAFDRSKSWRMTTRPKGVSPAGGSLGKRFGGRPCAVFEYEGPAAQTAEALRVMSYWGSNSKLGTPDAQGGTADLGSTATTRHASPQKARRAR